MTRRRPATGVSRGGEQGPRVQAPAWIRETLIACTDGPYTGMWWTADDWQARVTAARRMLEAGQRRGPVLDYDVAATATIPHPHQDALGHAARYQSAAARTTKAA
jgi:hypothetical protein